MEWEEGHEMGQERLCQGTTAPVSGRNTVKATNESRKDGYKGETIGRERRVFHREYAGAVLDPSGIITNFISLCIVYH